MFTIGKSAHYTFTGPWSEITGESVIESITSGSVLLDMGVDVFKIIFEDNGLSEGDYDSWLSGGGVLYVLKNGTTQHKVPDIYIELTAGPDTVEYLQEFLTVELGYLTETERALLPVLIETIRLEVLGQMGLEATIKNQSYGSVQSKPTPDHDAIVATRSGRITDSLVTRPTRATVDLENTNLKAVVAKYEEIIKLKVLTP